METGWRYTYPNVQEYKYDAKELHSYPIQMWLENGIISILAYMAILIYVLTKFKKNKTDIQTKSLIIAFLSVILHSLMDFDMSFYSVLILVFIYLGIIDQNGKKIKINQTIQIIVKIIIAILLIVFLIYDFCLCIYKITSNKTKNNLDYIEKYIKIIPYDTKLKLQNIKLLQEEGNENNQIYKEILNIVADYLEKEDDFRKRLDLANILIKTDISIYDEDDILYLKRLLLNIKDDISKSIYNEEYQMNRIRCFNILVDQINKNKEKLTTKNWEEISKFYNNIIIEEVDIVKEYIKNYQNCRYSEIQKNEYEKELEYIKEKAIKRQYVL